MQPVATGTPDPAVARYEGFLVHDPTNPLLLLLTLGDLHWRTGRSDDVLGCYERCLAAYPRRAVALGRIGNVLLARERYADAGRTLRQALQADGQAGGQAPSLAARCGTTSGLRCTASSAGPTRLTPSMPPTRPAWHPPTTPAFGLTRCISKADFRSTAIPVHWRADEALRPDRTTGNQSVDGARFWPTAEIHFFRFTGGLLADTRLWEQASHDSGKRR